jgi:hypothetical protein
VKQRQDDIKKTEDGIKKEREELEKVNEEGEKLEGEEGVVKELVGISLFMRFVLSFFRCFSPLCPCIARRFVRCWMVWRVMCLGAEVND